LFAFGVTFVALAGGCGSDDPPPNGSSSGGVDPTGNNTICLRVNCDTDRDCADCEEGKTVCAQKEHRCVACGPLGGNKKCPNGQFCTDYGDCVSNGTPACTTDVNGNASVTCNADADCAACDPKHRACNTATKKCVGCTKDNSRMCQSTDACVDDKCQAKCPSSCTTDAECGQCGAKGEERNACNRGQCAQCSETIKCPLGSQCDDKGTCVPSCGDSALDRPDLPGACAKDEDCASCTGGTTSCKLPIAGGTGTCAVPANGCSDLGKGVVKLPAPFDRATNTCSNDGDCAGVSADINVGAMLRKVTGIGSIKDASLKYGMNVCATVKVTGTDANCGVCLPCKQDTDCQDIDIQQVAGQALGPLGSIGVRILLDQIFGPNDHKIHMYCSKVIGEFGACLPCGNILSRCAQTQNPPTSTCDHTVCQSGGPLAPTPACESGCPARVCAADPYCCSDKWDQTCINRVERLCDPQKTCAPPDSCRFKNDGWYCGDQQKFAAFKCKGGQIEAGYQCANTQFCRRQAPQGQKSPAILTAQGVPQCFNTP
jgi:hypothetical protein